MTNFFMLRSLALRPPWSVDSVELSMETNTVTISVGADPQHSFSCPECGVGCPRHDKRLRKWRHLDTCQLATLIEAVVPRVRCPKHGVKLVDVPWAERGWLQNLLFESIVLKWLEVAPTASVAERMNIDWDKAQRFQHRAVQRGLERRGPVSPIDVTIDETSEKKGHNYLTVVREGDRVIHVEAGREKDSIDTFWKSLSQEALKKVRSVSMDLWAPYRASAKEHVPTAASKICVGVSDKPTLFSGTRSPIHRCSSVYQGCSTCGSLLNAVRFPRLSSKDQD